jgi:hypothetical protein
MAALNSEFFSELQPKQLMLFNLPATQTGVEKVIYEKIQPISQLSRHSPIEFNISQQNSLHYIDLQNSFISVKGRILHDDGKRLQSSEYVGPVNLLLHSLWERVDVTIQGKTVTPPSAHYSYKAMIETLLRFGSDAKTSQLSTQMWMKDTPGYLDDDDPKTGNNKSLIERAKLFSESKLVHMAGRISHDLFEIDRFILNQVGMLIQFYPAKPRFYLMTDSLNPDFYFHIEEMTLSICKVLVNPGIIYGHSMALQKTAAKYPFQKTEVKMTSIAQGLINFTYDNICPTRLPNKIVIGFVNSQAAVGSFSLSPWNFQGFDMSRISVLIDGIPVNGIQMKTNFNATSGIDTTEPYLWMLKTSGKWGDDSGNQITERDLVGGFGLYTFNVDPFFPNENYINLIKKGNVRLEVLFANPLPHPVTCVILLKYSSYFEITLTRDVVNY